MEHRCRSTSKSNQGVIRKAMMRVIINADDFGINEIVTREIEKLIKTGAISSTTIMANGKSLPLVEKIVHDHPEISYGAHLCMDEFDSLTASDTLYKFGLIDKGGKFIRGAIFEIKDYPDELKNAIIDELSAQIEKLLSLGIPISHIDSHHFHTIYKLKDVISYVMDKYEIEKVRLCYNISTFEILKNKIFNKKGNYSNIETSSIVKKMNVNVMSKIKTLLKSKYLIYLMNKYYNNRYKVTNGFESYSSFLNIDRVRKRYKDKDCIELMCHPGHSGKQYQKEAIEVSEMLLVNSTNYQLISYNEL
jgi:predicted glycoside hydrolase/deacetylase ChbG (UPF0249 family)